MYFFYNLILWLSLLFLVPYYGFKILVKGKYRKSIGPKLGCVSAKRFASLSGEPRIWIHAVSVGEVTAAAPIIEVVRDRLPGACIVLSTSTETGQQMARKIATGVDNFIYFPLDFKPIVRRMLRLVRPDVFVAVETEIWPNFIREASWQGVCCLLVNGRISPRSFRKYRATRFFWRGIFGLIERAGAISEKDGERLVELGASRSTVRVLGNAKYDGLASRTDDASRNNLMTLLGIAEGVPVFVSGSTHPGEEEIVLEVYRRLIEYYPDMLLILVPRHIERAAEVMEVAARLGFHDTIRLTEISAAKQRRFERLIVVDRIGELFRLYSLASIVFCGGSLVPRGGQNILEAAAWGKPVFFGFHMDDFMDEKVLLEEAGAGVTVHNADELFAGALRLMRDPEEWRRRGEAARRIVSANKGASKKYADLILSVLKA